MSFGERLRERREQLKMTRAELAKTLGVSVSAIGNYETGVSAPKEDVLLRLFDSLQVDPNTLYRDHYHGGANVLSADELGLLEQYRSLPLLEQNTLHAVMDALCDYRKKAEEARPAQQVRRIPLYYSPAAAVSAAPTVGEDFDFIELASEVPPTAEFAVRIQDNTMEPHIAKDSIIYITHEPLSPGDVGMFFVDDKIVCKQYDVDSSGTVSLLSLSRHQADEDVVLSPKQSSSLVFLGRVLMLRSPLPSNH